MAKGRSPLAALVARIDRDDLAESMLRVFRREIPGYGRLPASVVRGQVLDVVRQNLDLCLDWVGGGGPPEVERFEDFRVSAVDRASEGMPLEDLLRAYRLGGAEAWRALVANAVGAERDALPGAAELVMSYLDRASGLVITAYLEEREHHVSERERAQRALLDALVGDDVLDAGDHEVAAQLGFVLGTEFVAFASALPGQGAPAHARAAVGLRAVETLALTEGDRVVGLAMPHRDPAKTLPKGAVTVIDVPVPRAELAASLADVRLGVDVALRTGRKGVVPLRELTLDLLLARAPRVAADLRHRVLERLGPGEGPARGDLRRTVATYVELRRDRQGTAKRLHVHPNTLDHRLRRARELTGLDLDDPEDLATMVLALHDGS